MACPKERIAVPSGRGGSVGPGRRRVSASPWRPAAPGHEGAPKLREAEWLAVALRGRTTSSASRPLRRPVRRGQIPEPQLPLRAGCSTMACRPGPGLAPRPRLGDSRRRRRRRGGSEVQHPVPLGSLALAPQGSDPAGLLEGVRSASSAPRQQRVTLVASPILPELPDPVVQTPNVGIEGVGFRDASVDRASLIMDEV